MSKEMSVIVLGFLVILVPNLGIPASWRFLLLILTGAAIAILGFLLRGEALSRPAGRGSHQKTAHHPFVESTAANSASNHEQQDTSVV